MHETEFCKQFLKLIKNIEILWMAIKIVASLISRFF